MATAWKSNVPQVSALLLRAMDKGLQAAAEVYAAEMKRRLRAGFTSGDFVTGNLADSVTVAPPEWRDGKRWIAIGTNNLYALYWELGHLNIFIVDWVRKEVWVPTLHEMAPQLRAAYLEAAQRVLNGGAARYSAHVDVAAD